MLQLGEVKNRVENDDKSICAVCGNCPQGIYQVHGNDFARANKNLPPDKNGNKHGGAEGIESRLPTTRHNQQHCGCTATTHICVISKELGRASCHRTCHQNCDNPLCEFTPCPICAFFLSHDTRRFFTLHRGTDGKHWMSCVRSLLMLVLSTKLSCQMRARQACLWQR